MRDPFLSRPWQGDTWIDDHHTNEDIALALGTALSQALGSKRGINRFGNFAAPLDEALVSVVLDLSGRPYLGYDLAFQTENIGRYEVQLVEHFFQSLANTSGMTLHVRQVSMGGGAGEAGCCVGHARVSKGGSSNHHSIIARANMSVFDLHTCY